MSLQILMAGAACGKTTEVLKRVCSELSSTDLKKIWVILPDRRQINSFREKLLTSGSMIGLSTGLFYEFGNEILLKSDQTYTEAPELLLHRILQKIIQNFSQTGDLGAFGAIKDKPGFIQLVHRKVSELAEAGYESFPSDNLDPEVDVILKIYQAYQKRVKQRQWMDPHQIISMALDAVRSTSSVIKGLDFVAVDGFERFTPPQLNLLCQLAERGVKVLITLPGSDRAGRTIYQRAQESLEQFQSSFPDLELICAGDQPFLPSSILGLANNFLVDKPQIIEKQSDMRLLSAYSPLQEVREGLRRIRFLLNKSAFAGDCAILIPAEDQYSALLQTVANEYHIPIHFNWGKPLIQVAQLELILNLLHVSTEDFPRRLFLDVIRSPFVDLSNFGFKPADTAILERVSRYGPVVAGFDNWMKVLQRLATKGEESKKQAELDKEDDEIFNLPNADACQRLMESLRSLAAILKPPEKEKRITFWVEWLWQLLEDLGWLSQMPATTEILWFEKFKQNLREMCIADQELGFWYLDFDQFVAELEMGFQMSTFQQTTDRNKVQVLRLLDARGSRFEHVVILGLAEGVFPKSQREDPFLPEIFRQQAGLESHVEHNQIGVFYQAITRANSTLMVTRPYMSDKGEALEPSPYWNALIACLEEKDIEVVRSTTKRTLEDAASLEELFFWSHLFKIPIKFGDEHLSQTINKLNHQKAVLSSRQSKRIEGVYEGELEKLPPGLAKFEQKETDWSASRLETYKSCPMRFWTQYGLGVVEQHIPVLGLESFQIGSILHQILEDVYRTAEDPTNVDQLLDLLPVIARQVFDAAPETYQFEPTVYWQTQQEEWLAILQSAIIGLASEEWVPVAFEEKFGLDGKPALNIELDDGRMVRLHGVIDRIDQDLQGNLRIIDYKTGVSHLGKDDLIQGTRLQLPLYAMAAMQALKMGEVKEGFYWTLNGEEAGSLKLSKFQSADFEGPSGAIQVAKLHLQMIMDGLSSADFRPQVPDGGCPKYCGARLWCWRYHPGRQG
jgi:ATP-dependent helicase/DNAse subunit B